MASRIARALCLFAAFYLPVEPLVAYALPGLGVEDQEKTPKKATANPKKPAAKNSGESDKIKTDDRMSTRGLKPPAKDADSSKSDKPGAKSSSSSESNNPK
jgi:hypothetical protein